MKKITLILCMVLLYIFGTVPAIASESKEIEAVMERLEELPQYTTISINGSVESGEGIGYLIIYNTSEIYLIGNADNNGNTTFFVAPKSYMDMYAGMDSSTEQFSNSDYLDLLAYLIQAVDTSVDSYDAYVHLKKIMENGTYTYNDVQYEYISDIETLMIEYSNEIIEKKESKENATTDSGMIYTDTETIVQVQEALNAAGYDCGTPDGIAGNATAEAIKQYQQDNGLDVNGKITDELLNVLLVAEDTANSNEMPSGMILDEDTWQSWEMLNPCMLYPFMRAGEKAGFSFSLDSGQEESHKVCTFIFKDGNTTRYLEQAELYYGVEDQKITYTGLSTSDESMYLGDDFREACIRLMLGYNIHYDSDAKESVLNLTRERAEEIVNYCFENNVKHCLVDDMRIRLIRNDSDDNYYSFHMEYSKDSMNVVVEEETEDAAPVAELETETATAVEEGTTETASEEMIETDSEEISETESERETETEVASETGTEIVSEKEVPEAGSEETTEAETLVVTAETETEAITEESGDVATSISYGFVSDGLIKDFLLDGTYKCGVDFEPGDYFIYGYLGQSPAVKLENAMDEGSYTTGDDLLLKKMSFTDGEYIKLYHGAVMFSADDLDVENGKEHGIFIVGRDIQAGEYRVTTIKNEYTGELGNISGTGLGGIEIYDASLENKPVYSRRMFEQQTIIEIEEGQILILVNVQLEKI